MHPFLPPRTIPSSLSGRQTWEKAIYHLLQDYREKHMENFNMDDDEVYAAGASSSGAANTNGGGSSSGGAGRQQQAPARHQPAPSKRHVVAAHRRKTSVTINKYSESARQGSAGNLSSTGGGGGSASSAGGAGGGGGTGSTQSSPVKHRPAPAAPGRPAAPTPTKASEGQIRSPGRPASSSAQWTATAGAGESTSHPQQPPPGTKPPPPQLRLPVPQRANSHASQTSTTSPAAGGGSRPAGPRPPLSPRGSASEVVTTTTTVPAIILQEPSPNRPASTVLRGLSQSGPHGPSSSATTTTTTAAAAAAAAAAAEMTAAIAYPSSPSPQPLGPMASVPGSPSPSPLTIPQVQNMEVQRFFEDIVEQLSSIQAGQRQSISLPSPTAADQQAFLSSAAAYGAGSPTAAAAAASSPQHLVFPPFRPINSANAPPTTPTTLFPAQLGGGGGGGDLYDQFEDAENDMSDIASIHSAAPTTADGHGSVRTPSVYYPDSSEQMLPGLGLGIGLGATQGQVNSGGGEYGRGVVQRGNSVGSGPREGAGLRPPASPNPIRWSVASSVGSNSSQKQQYYVPGVGGQQQQQAASSYRTPSGSSYGSDKENGSAGGRPARQNSYDRAAIPRKPAPQAAASDYQQQQQAPYAYGQQQRQRDDHRRSQHGPAPPLQQQQHAPSRPPLGDGRSYNAPAQPRPAPAPATKAPASRTRKRASPFDPSRWSLFIPSRLTWPACLPSAALPPLGVSSVHAPQESSKRSWFTNLFSFKAPSATLYSLEDRRPTLLATRALLEALGAACTQEGSINSSAVLLRCRLDEVRDPSGSVVVAKAVRFRVEFQPCNERVGQASGFVTTVALVQEKGALSTFRSVEAKLRREWELDGPKTATLNPRQSLANSPLGGAFVYV